MKEVFLREKLVTDNFLYIFVLYFDDILSNTSIWLQCCIVSEILAVLTELPQESLAVHIHGILSVLLHNSLTSNRIPTII